MNNYATLKKVKDTNAPPTLHMEKKFLKKATLLKRNKRRGGGGVLYWTSEFAVAIRTRSCQDCSKAGAEELDIMQHMLEKSNSLNIPREAFICVIQRRCK